MQTAGSGEFGVGFRREKIMVKFKLLGLAVLLLVLSLIHI